MTDSLRHLYPDVNKLMRDKNDTGVRQHMIEVEPALKKAVDHGDITEKIKFVIIQELYNKKMDRPYSQAFVEKGETLLNKYADLED